MTRKHLQNQYKIRIVDEYRASGVSLRKFAKDNGVSASMLSRWNKNRENFTNSLKKCTMHKGPAVQGSEILPEIEAMITEASNSASPICNKQITLNVMGKFPEHLRNNDDVGSKEHYTRVYRWTLRVVELLGFSIRRPTHVAQNAQKSIEVFSDFIDSVNAKMSLYEVTGPYIFNMDQTCVEFDVVPRSTIVQRGTKTVHIDLPKTQHGGKCSTLLTVSGSGFKLPSLSVFSGGRNKTIHRRIIPKLNTIAPQVSLFTIQKNAWCDQEIMNEYIEKVWAPLHYNFPQTKILLLDSYSVHHTRETLQKFFDLNTIVMKIPAGCTNQLQILDVGVNKQFKTSIMEDINCFYTQNKNAKVGRDQIAEFITNSWQKITRESIIKTWHHIGFNV